MFKVYKINALIFFILLLFNNCKREKIITIDTRLSILGFWQRDSIGKNEEYYMFSEDNIVTIYSNDSNFGRSQRIASFFQKASSIIIDNTVYNIIKNDKKIILSAGNFSKPINLTPIQYNSSTFDHWVYYIKTISKKEIPDEYFNDYNTFIKENDKLYFILNNNQLCRYDLNKNSIDSFINLKIKNNFVSALSSREGYIYYSEYNDSVIYRLKGMDSTTTEKMFSFNSLRASISSFSFIKDNEFYFSTNKSELFKTNLIGNVQFIGKTKFIYNVKYLKDNYFLGLFSSTKLLILDNNLNVLKTYVYPNKNYNVITNLEIYDDRIWIILRENNTNKKFLSEIKLE